MHFVEVKPYEVYSRKEFLKIWPHMHTSDDLTIIHVLSSEANTCDAHLKL